MARRSSSGDDQSFAALRTLVASHPTPFVVSTVMRSLAAAPEDGLVAVGVTPGSFHLFDVDSGAGEREFDGPGGAVSGSDGCPVG